MIDPVEATPNVHWRAVAELGRRVVSLLPDPLPRLEASASRGEVETHATRVGEDPLARARASAAAEGPTDVFWESYAAWSLAQRNAAADMLVAEATDPGREGEEDPPRRAAAAEILVGMSRKSEAVRVHIERRHFGRLAHRALRLPRPQPAREQDLLAEEMERVAEAERRLLRSRDVAARGPRSFRVVPASGGSPAPAGGGAQAVGEPFRRTLRAPSVPCLHVLSLLVEAMPGRCDRGRVAQRAARLLMCEADSAAACVQRAFRRYLYLRDEERRPQGERQERRERMIVELGAMLARVRWRNVRRSERRGVLPAVTVRHLLRLIAACLDASAPPLEESPDDDEARQLAGKASRPAEEGDASAADGEGLRSRARRRWMLLTLENAGALSFIARFLLHAHVGIRRDAARILMHAVREPWLRPSLLFGYVHVPVHTLLHAPSTSLARARALAVEPFRQEFAARLLPHGTLADGDEEPDTAGGAAPAAAERSARPGTPDWVVDLRTPRAGADRAPEEAPCASPLAAYDSAWESVAGEREVEGLAELCVEDRMRGFDLFDLLIRGPPPDASRAGDPGSARHLAPTTLSSFSSADHSSRELFGDGIFHALAARQEAELEDQEGVAGALDVRPLAHGREGGGWKRGGLGGGRRGSDVWCLLPGLFLSLRVSLLALPIASSVLIGPCASLSGSVSVTVGPCASSPPPVRSPACFSLCVRPCASDRFIGVCWFLRFPPGL